MSTQNGVAQAPMSARVGDSGTASKTDGDQAAEPAPHDEADDFAEALKQWAVVLGSPAVLRAVECWGQRIAAEPERARLDHELRMQAHKDSARYYHTSRLFFIAALGLCLTFLGLVIWLLKGDKDLLLPVLTAVIGLLAGAGGGWVFGQRPVAREPGA